METIWKFPLEIQGSQEIQVPKGATILSVIDQNNIPVMYAIVDPEASKMPLKVQIRGTGRPVEKHLTDAHYFLGTVSILGGTLVWHVFVEKIGFTGH